MDLTPVLGCKLELVTLIKPSDKHQGYPGRMLGGIAATILDETIARSICSI